MSGCPLPVVICSGSGNQGLTVSVPIITTAEELGKSDDELYRALVFANLLTLYVKSGIGKLSAYCGVVSAGVVSVASIAFLKGDSKDIIEKYSCEWSCQLIRHRLRRSKTILCR